MNLLLELVETARETIAAGYYKNHGELKIAPSLLHAILSEQQAGRTAIIPEVKPADARTGAPSDGGFDGLIARYITEGATALAVVTEPRHFHGSLANLKKAVATGRPVLMRDIILDELQIDCAASLGASGVLLTASVLPKKRLAALIEYAHLADREVVLEVANRKEYEHALTTEAELICVNNRDLKSFELDLDRTRLAIEGIEPRQPVISHGGLRTRADVERVMEFADAVLVGSALIEGETTIAELRAS